MDPPSGITVESLLRFAKQIILRSPNMEDVHSERLMRLALAEATTAGMRGDVPVGAVVEIDGVVIAKAGNRRRSSNDPTAHAEVLALRMASEILGNWRVEGSLYVTQEPCPMCAGAIVNARVKRLVYGCENPKAGAVRSLFSLADDARLNHRAEIEAGVLAGDCSAILRSFFKSLRESKQE